MKMGKGREGEMGGEEGVGVSVCAAERKFDA